MSIKASACGVRSNCLLSRCVIVSCFSWPSFERNPGVCHGTLYRTCTIRSRRKLHTRILALANQHADTVCVSSSPYSSDMSTQYIDDAHGVAMWAGASMGSLLQQSVDDDAAQDGTVLTGIGLRGYEKEADDPIEQQSTLSSQSSKCATEPALPPQHGAGSYGEYVYGAGKYVAPYMGTGANCAGCWGMGDCIGFEYCCLRAA